MIKFSIEMKKIVILGILLGAKICYAQPTMSNLSYNSAVEKYDLCEISFDIAETYDTNTINANHIRKNNDKALQLR